MARRVRFFALFLLCSTSRGLTTPSTRTRPRPHGTAKRPRRWRGYATVAGGMLNHLALGSMASWGNFLSYCPPHLRDFAPGRGGGGFVDAAYVLPATVATHVALQPLLAPLAQRRLRSLALVTALGGLTGAAGIVGSARAPSLRAFLPLYAGLPGLGLCLGYTAPQAAAWSWFPERRALVSGLLLGAFGAGALVFNLVGTALANPANLRASAATGEFPAEVYAAFPRMLRGVGALYALLVALGASLIRRNDGQLPAPARRPAAERDARPEHAARAERAARDAQAPGVATRSQDPATARGGVTLARAARGATFWKLWLAILLATAAGLNTQGLYKVYATAGGAPALDDDRFLAALGGVAQLANGVARPAWGLIFDARGTRGPLTALLGAQALVMGLYARALSSSRAAFALGSLLFFFCYGGAIVAIPALANRVYGGGEHTVAIYSGLFSALGVAALGGSVVAKRWLLPSLGWPGTFRAFALMSLAAAAVLRTVDAN